MSDEKMKRCSRGENCVHPMGCWQPMTTEYFHVSKREASGFKNACKECRNNDYHKNAPDTPKRRRYQEIRELSEQGLKRCPKCDTIKEMSEEYFTKHARSNDALGAICKECQAKHRRIPEVKQRLKEQFYKYTKTDKYRSYQREYHNRPARKAHRRKYHANRSHLPKVRQQRRRTLMKYRTTKKQLSDTFTSDQEHRMYEYWNNQCAVCKVNFDMFITAQPDHWIPLSNEMSLGTVVENMIPLCSNRHGLVSHTACNQSKSGKDPKQWLIEKYGNKEGLRIYQEVMDYFEWAKKQSKRK